MKLIFNKSFILAAFLFGAASISNAQVKIGANPSTIDTNNALEVEATNGNKTTVNKATGQVTIKDGTQGVDRILTSDANGNASWKTTSEANIPTLMLRAYNPSTLQPSGSFYSPPVPLLYGNLSNYNPANGSYTVPESGFYEHNISLEIQGPSFDKLFGITTPIALLDGVLRGTGNTYWNARNVSGVKWFEAGEVITVTTHLEGSVAFTSAYKMRKVSIILYKR